MLKLKSNDQKIAANALKIGDVISGVKIGKATQTELEEVKRLLKDAGMLKKGTIKHIREPAQKLYYKVEKKLDRLKQGR